MPFFEAVQLFDQNKLSDVLNNSEYVLMENEMYLMNFANEYQYTHSNINISEFLFRVQSKSKNDYTFRHHLEATSKNDEKKIRIKSVGSFLEKKPRKVEIDRLGNIILIKN